MSSRQRRDRHKRLIQRVHTQAEVRFRALSIRGNPKRALALMDRVEAAAKKRR